MQLPQLKTSFSGFCKQLWHHCSVASCQLPHCTIVLVLVQHWTTRPQLDAHFCWLTVQQTPKHSCCILSIMLFMRL
jgi:hypothetical protein